MRLRAIATSCLLIAVSAGSVTTLAANPDCSRWIREYQEALAKRSVHAKRHVVRAARHLVVPRPHLLRASVPAHKKYTPRLTPAEMLKRFKILCGEDLPDDATPVQYIPTSLEANLVPPAFTDTPALPDVDGVPVTFAPATPIPAATPGQAVTPGATPAPFVPVAPAIPVVAPPGTTTGTGTTGTGTTGTGTTGTTGTTTGTGTTTTPSPVPEPNTFILLVTGAMMGVLGLILRRHRTAARAQG